MDPFLHSTQPDNDVHDEHNDVLEFKKKAEPHDKHDELFIQN
jgi:hypothetical protein